MAIGDEAAAAGLPVEPATADVRTGYVGLNRLADALARFMTAGTIPFTRITGRIKNAQIEDNAVTPAKIADYSVGTTKLANGAVTNAKLGDQVVSNRTIADRQVSPAKLTKRMAAGVVTLPSFQTGVTVETGLSGTAAMVVTSRGFAGTFWAQQLNTTGRFQIRASFDSEEGSETVSWIAMEV